jgi:serine protease Do
MNKLSSWPRPQALLLAVALALGIGIGGAGIASAVGSHAALDIKIADAAQAPSHSGFAPVVKRVLPAVVSVSSSRVAKAEENPLGQFQDDPMFRQFFGRGNGRSNPQGEMPEHREKGLGSGVIMTPDGYLLTNNHVVENATDVSVTLSDKREFKAKVVGTDPKTDIALLKIDASNLPVITVGDSSKVQVGDYALAIGNPFGVGQTVTMGIVSATGRSQLGIEDYEDFIQTDAAINPGNSGGALVNDRGELIGINTAIISHGSGGNQGIGFAIPANMARNVMQQIATTGKVRRAYLGVIPQDITPALARAMGEKDLRGALVGDVSPNGPAQKAGLEKGDIVLEANGKPVAGANDLRMTISMMAPETTVKLKVLRGGAEREVPVKLGELPSTEAAVQPRGDSSKSVLLGVSVQELDAQTVHELQLAAGTQGVVVTKVNPSSAAAEAGLKRGDVIQEVNRKPVRSAADFERAMGASKEDTLLLVNRHGSTLYLAV